MSNIGFEASVFASDGAFSYVDMENVFFGRGMRSALPSVPMDQIKQMFNQIGFTVRQKEAIFNLSQEDVNNALKDSTYFSNFLNPMDGNRPADGKRGDGKRRSYEGKNEIALKLLGHLAETIGLCDSTLSESSRFATKDDNMDGLIKIAAGGQVVISDNPAQWYVSPLDMSLMLLDAIKKDPVARKKIFNRYAERTKLDIDFTTFGENKEKVEEEFENALVNVLEANIKTNFPRAAYQAHQRVIAYSTTVEEFKKYVDSYKEKYTNLETSYEKLKGDPLNYVAFFRELDRVSSEGMQFGGIDVDGKKISGVPAGERTFDILKKILEGPDFKSEDRSPIRAAALLRVIDFTYARDPVLREDAIKWLTQGEKRVGGHIVTNKATELANEINRQINTLNKSRGGKDEISTIDPYKQFGFRKDQNDKSKVIFDSDAKILKIRALLADFPPTRATVAIWKKAEETYKNADEDLMDKLERYTYDYVVRSGAIAKYKPQNLNLLNDSVVEQLENLSEKYDPQNPGTWDSLDVQIAAKIAELEEMGKSAPNPAAPDEVSFRAFVEEVKQFMADTKPSPKETNGAITLHNVDNLLGGLIDDRRGVISGGHYGFKLKFFEKDFAEIKRQQEKGDFAVIEHSLPQSTAITELMEMGSVEATSVVIKAAEEFWAKLKKTPEEKDARIELEGSPFKGLTYAKITKIERQDGVADDKDQTPYSYAVIHFEANNQSYKITTTGAKTNVSRNENGELPPFTVWKDLAGIYKNMGANRINVECDDVATYFAIASAFANLGIECVNEQVKLSPVQAEQVRKILEAAIRRDIATGATVRERPATRMANKAIDLSQKKADELKETMEMALCAEALKENSERLDAASLETQTRVTELSEKPAVELAKDWVEVRDAGLTKSLNIAAESEIAEHFAEEKPVASDVLTLARLQLQKEGGESYDIRDLGKAISETPVDKAEYIAEKKDNVMEFVDAIRPDHPDTAKAIEDVLDNDFDPSNPDADPVDTFAAVRNIYHLQKDKDIADDALLESLIEEFKRQANINESVAHYLKLKNHCKGKPVIDKELKEEVDNFNYAASYALAELRKSPDEIVKILDKNGAKKDLQDKVATGTELNLQDFVTITIAVAKEWNGIVVTPRLAMELEQQKSYEEVERAFKQITKKGMAITDANMRKVAGYAYMEASNEILGAKPVDYQGLKERVDASALSKIAELGKKIGNTSMQTAKSLDDLGPVALDDKEFATCQEALGLEKKQAAKNLQKAFERYIKEGKTRS